MSTNIASIRSKYDELKIFTEELLDYDYSYKVLNFPEHSNIWESQSIEISGGTLAKKIF